MSNSVAFKLIGAPGGTLIDPAGPVSAVEVLRQTYGDRLDWDDLLEAFEERAGIAEFEGNETRQAAELIAADAVRKIALAQATDTFLEAGIDVTPQVFRRKVAGGPSILEAVRENGNVVELARTLASTLVRESQQRQRLAARLAGRSAPSVSATEFGTPHLNEDA